MILMNLIASTAFALDCDPSDDVCNIVDAQIAVANSYYAGSDPISDTSSKKRLRPEAILAQLRMYTDELEANDCVADTGHYTGFAGSYNGAAKSFDGENEGDVVTSGRLVRNGSEAYGNVASGTPMGNVYSRFNNRNVFMNFGDDAFVVSSVVRVAGFRGVHIGVRVDCQGSSSAGDALAAVIPYAPAVGAPMSFANLGGSTQIERMGMPAVNTALIASKNVYNESTPVDDGIWPSLSGLFVGEIVGSIDFLHNALNDDLALAGLTPCGHTGAAEPLECATQGGPLVLPDTLVIDPSGAAGFPNGRTLPDPVIDVTLAVLLLDLDVHGPGTLVGLNPTANDKAFAPSFPFLAGKH